MTGQTNDGGVIPCNTPGPGTMFYNPPKGSTKGLKELKVNFFEHRHSAEACGECGAVEGKDGNAFLDCGGCFSRKYCSKECQKAHWAAAHKEFCKKSAKAKQESVKPAVSKATTEEAVLSGLIKATIEDVD